MKIYYSDFLFLGHSLINILPRININIAMAWIKKYGIKYLHIYTSDYGSVKLEICLLGYPKIMNDDGKCGKVFYIADDITIDFCKALFNNDSSTTIEFIDHLLKYYNEAERLKNNIWIQSLILGANE